MPFQLYGLGGSLYKFVVTVLPAGKQGETAELARCNTNVLYVYSIWADENWGYGM